MIEYDMVWLGEQGRVFKVRQVLVEHRLLEERGKVRGETRGSTPRGNMLTVGSRRARVTWREGRGREKGKERGGGAVKERMCLSNFTYFDFPSN
jgi:hypothetical protein